MAFPTKAKYVIIGAGIHGLSTAWHIAEKIKKLFDDKDLRSNLIINGEKFENASNYKKLKKYLEKLI